MSFSLSASVSIGASISVGGFAPTTQSFTTIPVTNTQPALYGLSIRAPGSGFGAVETYIFPLSPRSLRKESMAYNAMFDVAGPAANAGILRGFDQFGQSPPVFVIQGTTGWKMHSGDGFSYPGLASIQKLEQMLIDFATFNQLQMQAQNPNLYTLEFYDFFRQQFWEVVPIGPQGIQQDASLPLAVFYNFRLAAARNLASPPAAAIDLVSAALSGVGASASISATVSFSANLTLAY